MWTFYANANSSFIFVSPAKQKRDISIAFPVLSSSLAAAIGGGGGVNFCRVFAFGSFS